MQVENNSSGAKDKQATQRGAEQTSNSATRNKQATHISETRDGSSFVARHFFIVCPIHVMKGFTHRQRFNLQLRFIKTRIGRTLKKWLATKWGPSRVSLMWVACLFRASLSCLFVFSARRYVTYLNGCVRGLVVEKVQHVAPKRSWFCANDIVVAHRNSSEN